ncbi:MAG: hypothetical protein IPI73_24625 [Betaproteobacteria bacterium]|nr:hypothetical protein [Betaproteobacteria bacterium]
MDKLLRKLFDPHWVAIQVAKIRTCLYSDVRTRHYVMQALAKNIEDCVDTAIN